MTHTIIDKRKSQMPTATEAVLHGGPADGLKRPIKTLSGTITVAGRYGIQHKTKSLGTIGIQPGIVFVYTLYHIEDNIAYYQIDGRKGNVGE